MKKILYILVTLFCANLHSQIVVIDPGHGYGATTSNNPDGRTATEIETALAVGLKTRTLIQNSCTSWTVQMTRTTNLNSWISVTQRATMSNNWNADRLLSIHCNAGGGTGTETFYCTTDDTTTAPDIAFAQKIQADMVTNGAFNNRRCVEDNSFLGYHLGVLRYSNATGCLNEIGFVDNTADAAKLTSDSWRDSFAQAYFNSLKSSLNLTCASTPGAFTLTATPECSGTTSRINLTWTASANATGYDIYRNGSLYASNITGTQYLNTFVTSGTSYTYYVKAINSVGSTNNSNGTLSRTAVTCAPGAFTANATPTCSGSTSAINVTWTASANATSYDIYRNGNLYASDVTGTSFLNTYLITAGTTYTYYVKAKNSVGTLNNSNGNRSATATACAARMSNSTNVTNAKEITLFPNPAQNEINIIVENTLNEEIFIEIYDLTGKSVFTSSFISKESNLQKTVDISQFSVGTYFVKTTVGGEEFIKQIIKK
ncbi:N-acetylmuramoyl-L-alanine amidase [Flavobacterium sp.]|uniref:N-acetylmuramoyl-L-alanine amidase n=1 Tax=Flavobacterium sp. TaxID=239 RepID=UPI00261E031A|nr:N-acetylmuramoyl-L-alanine amidase [Flavobacterium sp.]